MSIEEKRINIVSRTTKASIGVDEIMYIRRDGRKLEVHCKDKVFTYYEKMKSIKEVLDDNFYWCLQSLVVNLPEIKIIDRNCLFFTNGEVLDLTPNACSGLKKTYEKYLKNI